jgi:uncharacterized protein (TIGR02099 family)
MTLPASFKVTYRALRAAVTRAVPFAVLGLVVVALALAAARLTLDSAPAYRGKLSGWLSQTVGYPVSVREVAVRWRGWTPELELRGVTVAAPSGEPAVQVARMRLVPDLLASIAERSPRLRRTAIEGVSLGVVREDDGTFTVLGLGGAPGSADPHLLPRLLLASRSRVDLVDAEVVWEDRLSRSEPMRLSAVELQVRNAGARHRLQARASLPGAPGAQALLVVEAHGDLSSRDWDGRAWLQVQGLSLARWPGAAAAPGLAIRGGVGGLEAWAFLEQALPVRSVARVSAGRFTLGLGQEAVEVEAAEGWFQVTRGPGSWHVAGVDLRVQTHHAELALPALELLGEGSGPWDGFRARAPSLTLRSIPPVRTDAGTPTTGLVRGLLEAASGTLSDLWLDYRPGAPGEPALRWSLAVERLALVAAGGQGAARQLSGRVTGRGDQGRATLDTGPASLELPRLFPEPLAITRAAGALSWRRDADRWVVESPGLTLETADLRLDLAGQVSGAPGEGGPYAALQAVVHGPDLCALPRYLPSRAMKPWLHDWLAHALPLGRAERTELVLHGPLAAFPFDRGEGRFEVLVRVADGTVRYLPDWPQIDDVQAEVALAGRSLVVRAARARVLGSPLGNVEARIPDLSARHTTLGIRGRAEPTGADTLRFIQESGLRPSIRRRFRKLSVSEAVTLDLDLELHPDHDDPRPGKIEGAVTFRGNRVAVDELAFELAQTTGELRFRHDRLWGERVKGRLGDLPVTLSVDSGAGAGDPDLRFELAGSLTAAQLRQALDPVAAAPIRALASRLSGEATWRAVAEVTEDARLAPEVALSVESDLRGLAVDLPDPIGKSAGEASPLRIETTIGGADAQPVRVRYTDALAASVLLARGDGATRLVGADVRVGRGAQPPPVPAASAVRLTGEIERLNAGQWLDVAQTLAESTAGAHGPADTGGASPRPLAKHIDLAAREIALMGHRVDDTRVIADFEPPSGWTVALRGEGASGVISLPPLGSGQPVVLGLDRLTFRASDVPAPPARRIDPRALPPIELRCREFSFLDRPLGNLSARARPEEYGLSIDSLRLEGPTHAVSASGQWRWNVGEPVSRFAIDLKSPDLGYLLATLGYDDSGFDGGKTHITVDARWAGSPAQFSLDGSEGRVTLEVKDGTLTEVEPGAGRIFGLLSVQALPSRLRLDFRDLFSRGLPYERIEGSFTVEGGDAYTNDLSVIGNSARVDVAGRTGLIAQDYDQLVTVTPSVSTTLPIAGALAGGPVGAVAAFVAGTLFKEQINRAARFQYTVSGSWQQPVVERVQGPPAEPEPR